MAPSLSRFSCSWLGGEGWEWTEIIETNNKYNAMQFEAGSNHIQYQIMLALLMFPLNIIKTDSHFAC